MDNLQAFVHLNDVCTQTHEQYKRNIFDTISQPLLEPSIHSKASPPNLPVIPDDPPKSAKLSEPETREAQREPNATQQFTFKDKILLIIEQYKKYIKAAFEKFIKWNDEYNRRWYIKIDKEIDKSTAKLVALQLALNQTIAASIAPAPSPATPPTFPPIGKKLPPDIATSRVAINVSSLKLPRGLNVIYRSLYP